MLGETESEDQIQRVSPETVRRERPCRIRKGEDLQMWRQAKRLQRRCRQRRRKRHSAGWDTSGETEVQKSGLNRHRWDK